MKCKVVARTAFFVALALLAVIASSSRNPGKAGESDLLNLATVRIESDFARKVLKQDHISVRKRNTRYVPIGSLEVLRLESISDGDCREQLQRIFRQMIGKEIGARRIKKRHSVFSLRDNAYNAWISRASGAYSLSRTEDMVVAPTTIRHFTQAVQIALEFAAHAQLLNPVEGEEIDIVSVSELHNAFVVSADPRHPEEQFISDHYVRFGRRYKGVPIIGSHLTLRVDGAGNIAMFDKTWRPIVEITQKRAIIDGRSIEDRLGNHHIFRETYGAEMGTAKEISIVDLQCGYMEAPLNYRQHSLRPGCIVGFSVGKSAEPMNNQIVMSLEDGVGTEAMWGSKLRID